MIPHKNRSFYDISPMRTAFPNDHGVGEVETAGRVQRQWNLTRAILSWGNRTARQWLEKT